MIYKVAPRFIKSVPLLIKHYEPRFINQASDLLIGTLIYKSGA